VVGEVPVQTAKLIASELSPEEPGKPQSPAEPERPSEPVNP
jgi:hypothetical protein